MLSVSPDLEESSVLACCLGAQRSFEHSPLISFYSQLQRHCKRAANVMSPVDTTTAFCSIMYKELFFPPQISFWF